MSKLRLVILTGIVAIVLLTTFGLKNFATTAPQAPQPATKPEVGFSAPDFSLKGLDGKTVKLSNLRGKPVFINFWASWCPPCKEEIPEIQKFYEKYQGRVEVLAVNITFNDKMPDILNILQADHATYPVLLDEDNNHPVADDYQVDGIPASFFVDKDGVIRDIHVGGMNLQMLEASISKAM